MSLCLSLYLSVPVLLVGALSTPVWLWMSLGEDPVQGCVEMPPGQGCQGQETQSKGWGKEDKVWGNSSIKTSKNILEGAGLQGH